jgi:molybdopterin-guanine dinucleotide biosynthesis protein A
MSSATSKPIPAFGGLIAPKPDQVTLGILAGGRATRLGGIDKAWLQRDGQPQVLWLAHLFARQTSGVLVSANRGAARYAEHGLRAIADRVPDIGPLGGLDVLAHACATCWLLTLPVDVVSVDHRLLPSLAAAGSSGAYGFDDDGAQPLIALWPVSAARRAIVTAIASGDYAVHTLQARLGMACVRFSGLRFGNLNTPDDLAAAGIDTP